MENTIAKKIDLMMSLIFTLKPKPLVAAYLTNHHLTGSAYLNTQRLLDSMNLPFMDVVSELTSKFLQAKRLAIYLLLLHLHFAI